MINKFKTIGLGALLSVAVVASSVYYFLSPSQPALIQEAESLEGDEKEEIVFEPRKAKLPPSTLPIKETTAIGNLFKNINSSSVAYGFQTYLIEERDSNKPWKPKLKIWKDKISDGTLINPFTWNKEKGDPTIKNIKDRCEKAYGRTSWNVDNSLKSDQAIQKYWGMVWTMCSKKESPIPENWGKNKLVS